MNDLITMGANYKSAAQKNYWGYMDESGTYQRYPCMLRLKNYVKSQLWWDADRASVDEIAYEFIDFYYGPVAQEFKAYYGALKTWQVHQSTRLGMKFGTLDSTVNNVEYWPYGVMTEFADMIDGMLKKLEALKTTDLDAYNMYFDRVNVERLWVTHTLAKMHAGNFESEVLNDMVDYVLKYGAKYKILQGDDAAEIESWRV